MSHHKHTTPSDFGNNEEARNKHRQSRLELTAMEAPETVVDEDNAKNGDSGVDDNTSPDYSNFPDVPSDSDESDPAVSSDYKKLARDTQTQTRDRLQNAVSAINRKLTVRTKPQLSQSPSQRSHQHLFGTPPSLPMNWKDEEVDEDDGEESDRHHRPLTNPVYRQHFVNRNGSRKGPQQPKKNRNYDSHPSRDNAGTVDDDANTNANVNITDDGSDVSVEKPTPRPKKNQKKRKNGMQSRQCPVKFSDIYPTPTSPQQVMPNTGGKNPDKVHSEALNQINKLRVLHQCLGAEIEKLLEMLQPTLN